MAATLTAAEAYDALAEVYDAAVPDPVGFADYYLRTCAGADREVLYVGCGTGRLLTALALAGSRCVGVDPSAGMLARAAARVQAAGLAGRVVLREGVAQDVSPGHSYDRIVMAGGAFEYLLSTRDQLRALFALAAQLRPNGSMHLDIAAPPHLTTNLRGNFAGELDPRLGPHPPVGVTGSRVRIEVDHLRQLVRSHCVFERAAPASTVEATYVTRYTTAHELRLLARVAGMRARVYGDFDGGPVGRGSSNYVAELTHLEHQ
jgi:SAM-dependent methyltransferase